SLSAVYNGDANHAGSTASAVTVTAGSPNARWVTQLYRDLLLRTPDPTGLTSWSSLLEQGGSRLQVTLAVESSLEYRVLQVEWLFHRFLLRSADPMGLNSFTAFLGAGGTVEQLQAVICSSAEYFQVRGGGDNAGFLQALYQDALGRAIDPSGQAGFTQA